METLKVKRTPRPPFILNFCGFRSLAAPCSHNSSPIGRVLQPQKNFIEPKSLNAPVETLPGGVPPLCQLGLRISFSNTITVEQIRIGRDLA